MAGSEEDFFDDLDSLQQSPKLESPFWKVFYELTTLLNTSLGHFDLVLDGVIQAAFALTQAQRAFLCLLDDQGQLQVHLARDQKGRAIPVDEQQISQTVLDRVLDREEGLFVANLDDQEEYDDSLSIQELKILSVMCVPLKIQDKPSISPVFQKIRGLLYVDSQSLAPHFDEEKLQLLQMLANYATSAILHSQYYEASTVDLRTGAFNRRHFEILLGQLLSPGDDQPLCLVMMDIDGFDRINKTLGYEKGDDILRNLTKLCLKTLSRQEIFARYGGDEFGALFPQTTLLKSREKTENLAKVLGDFLKAWNLSLSFGGAMADWQTETPLSLKRKALQALTKAKEGDSIVFWDKSLAHLSPKADKLSGVFSGEGARDYRNILALMETIGDVNSTLELQKLLPLIVDRLIELSGADRAILVFAKNGKLDVQIARDRKRQALPPSELEFSHSIIHQVIEGKTPICISDTLGPDDRDLQSPSILELELRSIMAFPLLIKDKLWGALYIDGRATNPQFDLSQLSFFESLANQMAMALENAHLFEANLQKKKQLEILNEKLKDKVQVQAHELIDVKAELKDKQAQLEGRYHFGNIIGKSPKMQEIYRTLEKLAPSDVPVFIYGESGTGKELIARAIHFNSHRKARPFISENCAAVNENLLESELFGHVKGAFTGADSNRQGLFEQAEGGSLFLDEIGDMSLGMQKKLLRVLQEKELRRVGDNHTIPVDVRIISATNRDLKALIDRGDFRQDLFYRINVLSIQLPPLRDRPEDIPLLIDHFIQKHWPDGTSKAPPIPKPVWKAILQYPWPGNIRELENEVVKLIAIGDDSIDWKMIRANLWDGKTKGGDSSIKSLKDMERECIITALQRTGGNKKEAAKQLGITRKTLYNKMSAYRIKGD